MPQDDRYEYLTPRAEPTITDQDDKYEYLTPRAPKPAGGELSGPDWWISQGLRTAPAVGLGLVGGIYSGPPGGVVGAGTGSAIGDWLGQQYEIMRGYRPEYKPWETVGNTAIGAIPGFLGTGKIAGTGMKELLKYAGKRAAVGAVEGGVISGATTPVQNWAADRGFTATPEEVLHNAGGGAAMGSVLGGGFGLMHGSHAQTRLQQIADAQNPVPSPVTPPPPPPPSPAVKPRITAAEFAAMQKARTNVAPPPPPTNPQGPIAKEQSTWPEFISLRRPQEVDHKLWRSRGYINGPPDTDGFPQLIKGPTTGQVQAIENKNATNLGPAEPSISHVEGNLTVPTKDVTPEFIKGRAEEGQVIIAQDANNTTFGKEGEQLIEQQEQEQGQGPHNELPPDDNPPPSLKGGVLHEAIAHLNNVTDENEVLQMRAHVNRAIEHLQNRGDAEELSLHHQLLEAVDQKIDELYQRATERQNQNQPSEDHVASVRRMVVEGYNAIDRNENVDEHFRRAEDYINSINDPDVLGAQVRELWEMADAIKDLGDFNKSEFVAELHASAFDRLKAIEGEGAPPGSLIPGPANRHQAILDMNYAFDEASKTIRDGHVDDAHKIIHDAAQRLNQYGYANEAEALVKDWNAHVDGYFAQGQPRMGDFEAAVPGLRDTMDRNKNRALHDARNRGRARLSDDLWQVMMDESFARKRDYPIEPVTQKAEQLIDSTTDLDTIDSHISALDEWIQEMAQEGNFESALWMADLRGRAKARKWAIVQEGMGGYPQDDQEQQQGPPDDEDPNWNWSDSPNYVPLDADKNPFSRPTGDIAGLRQHYTLGQQELPLGPHSELIPRGQLTSDAWSPVDYPQPQERVEPLQQNLFDNPQEEQQQQMSAQDNNEADDEILNYLKREDARPPEMEDLSNVRARPIPPRNPENGQFETVKDAEKRAAEAPKEIPQEEQEQEQGPIGRGIANLFKKSPTGEPSTAEEMWGLASNLTTTGDVSPGFRQGLPQVFTKEWRQAIGPMLRSFADPKYAAKVQADLDRLPVFQRPISMKTGKRLPSIADNAGMAMINGTKMGQSLGNIVTTWAETGKPLGPLAPAYRYTIGRYVKASNRAYALFLNHLRGHTFQNMMNQGRDMSTTALQTGEARPGLFKQRYDLTTPEGITSATELNPYTNPLRAKEIADFVNTATGSGPLKGHIIPVEGTEINLEFMAKALKVGMFAPRLMASRMRMLSPATYAMASPQVRKQYLKSALSTGMFWFGINQLAKLAGEAGIADVELTSDMNSADFGKPRISNTRLDPGGGFQQFFVTLNRLLTGHVTPSTGGAEYELGSGFRADTRKDIIERFLVNKLNPAAKFAYDLANASQRVPFHMLDRTAQMFIPLVYQDLFELMKENPNLLPLMIPVAFGMGTQTYDRGESVSKIIPEENDFLFEGGDDLSLPGIDSLWGQER